MNELRNIQYLWIYNNNGTSIHSSNVEDCNIYFINKENNEFININSWPFLVMNEELSKYTATLDINKFETCLFEELKDEIFFY